MPNYPHLEQLARLTSKDVRSFLNANSVIGTTLLSKLLNWALNLEDPLPLIERLVELNPSSLGKLNAAVGLQILKAGTFPVEAKSKKLRRSILAEKPHAIFFRFRTNFFMAYINSRWKSLHRWKKYF